MPFMGTTSSDDWKTGSIAAACGGTTTIVDFSLQGKGESLRDAVDRQKAKADGKTVVDYSIHPGVTDARPDVIDEVKKAIHEYGTPSFKIFLFYDFRVDDYAMIRLLEETKKHGGLVQVHAESCDIIRRLNEQLAAAGTLAPMYHARAHAMLAEEQAVDRGGHGRRVHRQPHLHRAPLLQPGPVEDPRGPGPGPAHLRRDLPAVPHPDRGPLQRARLGRGEVRDVARRCGRRRACDELWQGLRDGDVQTIGTDHCPFNFKGQKDMNGKDDYKKIPNGAPGIETMLMLLHTEGVVKGRITLERMVDVLSTGTARMFGLANKGAVAAGKDADIVVFDPKRKFTITQKKLHQNVDYTPWEGLEVTGTPEVVYSRGRRVAEWAGDQMKFVGEVGAGQVREAGAPAAF